MAAVRGSRRYRAKLRSLEEAVYLACQSARKKLVLLMQWRIDDSDDNAMSCKPLP